MSKQKNPKILVLGTLMVGVPAIVSMALLQLAMQSTGNALYIASAISGVITLTLAGIFAHKYKKPSKIHVA